MNRKRGPRPVNLRLRRLLVMLPWLAERGTVSTREMADHFGMSVSDLISDLTMASLCGVSPYPLDLIDLWVDEEAVHFGISKYFDKPLRLTPTEAFSLVVSVRAAAVIEGDDSPLARALVKMASVLGDDALEGVVVDVEIPDDLEDLRLAAEEAAELELQYWSPTSGEVAPRTVVPIEVFAEGDHWYLRARDLVADGERTYRIDRIESWRATGRTVEVEAGERRPWFEGSDDATVVRILVDSDWLWVLEKYPLVSVEDAGAGRHRITLLSASERWLDRILVRLGSRVTVESPASLTGRRVEAAARVLEIYERR